MISSSIKGKGNISAIKTGKNNYEIEGVEVGKKFRGQGLGSQLYGSITQKIGSGSTIKSVLLPQEQALADYASGKSIPAKAIFPPSDQLESPVSITSVKFPIPSLVYNVVLRLVN